MRRSAIDANVSRPLHRHNVVVIVVVQIGDFDVRRVLARVSKCKALCLVEIVKHLVLEEMVHVDIDVVAPVGGVGICKAHRAAPDIVGGVVSVSAKEDLLGHCDRVVAEVVAQRARRSGRRAFNVDQVVVAFGCAHEPNIEGVRPGVAALEAAATSTTQRTSITPSECGSSRASHRTLYITTVRQATAIS